MARTPKVFSGEEEHEVLQRIATLETRMRDQHDFNVERITANERDIAAIKTDLGIIHDAYQQSIGGKAMLVAAGGAVGFFMSVVTFYLTVHFGAVTP